MKAFGLAEFISQILPSKNSTSSHPELYRLYNPGSAAAWHAKRDALSLIDVAGTCSIEWLCTSGSRFSTLTDVGWNLLGPYNNIHKELCKQMNPF